MYVNTLPPMSERSIMPYLLNMKGTLTPQGYRAARSIQRMVRAGRQSNGPSIADVMSGTWTHSRREAK